MHLSETYAYRSAEAAYLEPPDDPHEHDADDPDFDPDAPCLECDGPDEEDLADRARDEARDRLHD